MNKNTLKEPCFICDKECSLYPLELKYIKYYQINVCRDCYLGNHDGWSPEAEKRILPHLQENGIEEPERNSKGFLPLEVY